MTQRSISGFLLAIVLPVLLCGMARGIWENDEMSELKQQLIDKLGNAEAPLHPVAGKEFVLLAAEVELILRAFGSAQDTPAHLNFFSENVDAWGAAEWFNRLATAVREQDAAVVAGDEMAMDICRNVASSSAMRLVRDYEQQVRAALAPRSPAASSPVMEYIVNGGDEASLLKAQLDYMGGILEREIEENHRLAAQVENAKKALAPFGTGLAIYNCHGDDALVYARVGALRAAGKALDELNGASNPSTEQSRG